MLNILMETRISVFSVFLRLYLNLSFHSKHNNDFKYYELAFKYGVWPGKVNILKYAEGRRVSLWPWDNT